MNVAGGRPPSGPKLVKKLEGSTHAKERLETILATIVGGMTIAEACRKLGIGETAFNKIRTAALAAALKELEPKQLGRPPKPESDQGGKVEELEARAKWLEEELEVSRLKEELAATLPYLAQRQEEKEAAQDRRSEEKKRRRRERRARARRGAAAADRRDDRPGGGGGDTSGSVRPPGDTRAAAGGADGASATQGSTGPGRPGLPPAEGAGPAGADDGVPGEADAQGSQA
jgi:hypothetical protein